jgi:hypothetical protein
MSRVYIAPVSFGLGDLVVSLPAVQALIAETSRTGAETWLVARSEAQGLLSPRIAGLAGWVDERDLERAPPGRVVDLRDHPLQRDHWWGSPEFEAAFGSLSINDILTRMCADFGIAADFSRPVPLTAFPRPEVRECVLLVTETDGPGKHWPCDRWAALAAAVRADGLDVRLLSRAGSSPTMRAAGVDDVLGPTPGDAVDLLGSCRAVVGVDTGLTHIAAQQGTPTLTICRRGSVFFRPWSHCRALTGEPCDDECLAIDQRRAYNERVSLRDFVWRPPTCPTNGRCLAAIRPEQAIDALRELL